MKFNVSDYNQLVSHYQKEADSSVAILASSFLDNCLEQCIREKLADDDVKNKLFQGYGPLATFSAKIDIALLLGLIPIKIHKDLNTIRRIRNLFAHKPEPTSFDAGQMRDLASNLLPAIGIPRSDGTERKTDGARAQFLHAVSWCLIHIETERDRTTKLIIPKFHFEEVVEDDNA